MPSSAIRAFLQSGAKGNGRQSIFALYGRPDLDKLSTHMFRRLNTTQMRLAGVNSMYIARQAGRSVKQVDAYDYLLAEDLNNIVEEKFKVSDVFTEAIFAKSLLASLEDRGIPVKSITDFIKEDLSQRSRTDLGSCGHELSISPCPAFKACYMRCGDYWISKGDPDEVRRHRMDFENTAKTLLALKRKLTDNFYASHYVTQYGTQFLTLKRILEIHEDPSIPLGTMVKPSPNQAVPTRESLERLLANAEEFAAVDEQTRRIVEHWGTTGDE